jgi:plastocyanin
MIFTRLTSVFVLPAAVLAQYGGPPPSSGTTTSAAPPSAPSAPPDTPGRMNIDVAFNGQFMFHPNNISAAVGTLVTFWFPGGDIPHSVTQSSFEEPCTYLTANSSAGTGAGFDSGLTNSVQFTLNVTDDQPVWFHCKQLLHCGMGMVGSINAPSNGSTFQVFQAAAMKIGPSETAQTSGGPVTGGVHGVAAATPAATGTSSSSSSSSSSAITNVASMGIVLFAFLISLILA